MKQPLVSILIPFKNTEDYLAECLDSITQQTYKNWEVWAVDDSSTDDSWDIASNYATNEPRINVVRNSGNGIIHALRKAYEKCQGDFITRMDADDIMTVEKINTMVNFLLKHGEKHVAIGQVKYFSHRGISNGYARYEEWLNLLTEKGNNYSEIYKECVIPSPCWMVFKDDFDHCGAFESDRYPEDYDLAFRFYENGMKCIPCDKLLHHWRDYDSRTSRTSEHYAANYFLEIKMHYFLKLEYNPKRPLVVWGAGNKGKTIAKNLIDRKLDFIWVCDNPNKIGKDIYGKKLLHFRVLNEMEDPQTIITVANEKEQDAIRSFFESLNKLPIKAYFFFC